MFPKSETTKIDSCYAFIHFTSAVMKINMVLAKLLNKILYSVNAQNIFKCYCLLNLSIDFKLFCFIFHLLQKRFYCLIYEAAMSLNVVVY